MEGNQLKGHDLYDLSRYGAMSPCFWRKPLNYDFSGYITLVEESYNSFVSAHYEFCDRDYYYDHEKAYDPDFISFGVYLHVMVEYLWARLFYLAEKFGQRFPFYASEFLQKIDAEKIYIPTEIHEYLKHIGEFKDNYGNRWCFNIPENAIPQPATADIPGGHFGKVTAENHNLYECYISPYVTSMHLKAEMSGETNFDPLPPNFIPTDTKATEDLLGYFILGKTVYFAGKGRIKSIIQGATFGTDNIGSRIKHSQELQNHVNRVLTTFESQLQLVQGLPMNLEGSSALTSYVMNDDGSSMRILRNSNDSMHSKSQLSQSEIGVMALFAYRRKRDRYAPGYCLLTKSEEAIDDWESSINDNFELRGVFGPNIGSEPDEYQFPDTDSLVIPRNLRISRSGLLRHFIKQKETKTYELPDVDVKDFTYSSARPFNCDFSGYITLIEKSYDVLSVFNSQFSRCVTLSAFMHVMVGYLWVRLFYLAKNFGQRFPFSSSEFTEFMQEINAKEIYIPTEIHEYLKHIGEFKDKCSNKWQPNLPQCAIPNPGGHFGEVTPENHNLYECYIAPYTTAMRVEAEMKDKKHFDPLPPDFMPTDTEATENFLGYTKEFREVTYYPRFNSRKRYDFKFGYRNTMESRLQYSKSLQKDVNGSLISYIKKEKLVQGLPLNLEGSSAALAYVMTTGSDDIGEVLWKSDVQIESGSQLSNSEIEIMSLFGYRRKRSIQKPGYCLLKTNGEVLKDWDANINNNFDLKQPFEQKSFQLNPAVDTILNERNFQLGPFFTKLLVSDFINRCEF